MFFGAASFFKSIAFVEIKAKGTSICHKNGEKGYCGTHSPHLMMMLGNVANDAIIDLIFYL